MQTRVRADGTSHVESSRTIYIAIASGSPETRGQACPMLAAFQQALGEGRAPADCATVFPGALRALAEQAVLLVREFERLVGRETGVEVIEVWTPDDPKALALQSPGRLVFGREASELADRVAQALAALLGALGFERVFCSNVD